MKTAALACVIATLCLSTYALAGTRVSWCGGDGQQVCPDTPNCDAWVTINPGFPSWCIACGGDGFYVCSSDPAVTPSPTPCREWREVNPSFPTHCIACGNQGQSICDVNATTLTYCQPGYVATVYGTCETVCGADAQAGCYEAPRCSGWATPHPVGPTDCIACGGDGFYVCSTDPALSSSPSPCRQWREVNASFPSYCIACGNDGQAFCDLSATTLTECQPGLVGTISSTCAAACGGDAQPACWDAPRCGTWATPHPVNNSVCIACGGDGHYVCATNPTLSSSPSECREYQEVNTSFPTHCIACGNDGQSFCMLSATTTTVCRPGLVGTAYGTCATACGADNQAACWDAPKCGPWATPHPADSNFCTACGGDGFNRCSLDDSASPGVCRPGHTINPNFVHLCSACGGPGQLPCEPTTNNTIDEVPTQDIGGPVWGWAELHTHMFANEAYGGATLWGRPYDINGVNKALSQCDYTWNFVTVPSAPIGAFSGLVGPGISVTNGAAAFLPTSALLTNGYPVHGTNWVTPYALVPTQVLFGLTVNISTGNITQVGAGVDFEDPASYVNIFNIASGAGLHHTAGMTDFYRGTEAVHGWPHFLDGGHTQMYHRWVERAYEAGLRLMIDMPVNNELLCEVSNKHAGYSCNDMDAIAIQIAEIRALEDFVDLDNDGIDNGNGWYRVAETPQEARAIIEDGAMAVVIGTEIDSLFDCKPGVADCNDPTWLAARVDALWLLGVRHVYPVHLFDNAFAGAALYDDIMELASYIATDEPVYHLDCSNLGQTGPGGTEVPAGYTHVCNARGLTEEGQKLMTALMDKGMLIDIDHLSHFAIEGDPFGDPLGYGNQALGVLDMMEARGYPPLSSHSVITPIAQAGTEYGHTEARAERILRMGGMVAMNPVRRYAEVATPDFDPGTSFQFVHGAQQGAGSHRFGYLEILDLIERSVAANNAGRTHLDREWLDPEYPAFGLASDTGAFVNQPGPRFLHLDYHEYDPIYLPEDDVPHLDYPFEGFEPMDKFYPAGAKTGKFFEQVTGSRRFDYNIDGMAHYGLVPDMLADAREVLNHHRAANPGQNVPTLRPLMSSAEAFIRMWERIPAFTDPTDRDGDGDLDAADNCPFIANANQLDLDEDGIGDACDTDVDGDGIDDGDDPCNDNCDIATGQCTANPCCGVSCDSPPNIQCWEATGSCSAGACSYLQAADGEPCDDGDSCTIDDQCDAAGNCVSTAAGLGASCDDADPCTENDSCDAAGACSGAGYSCAAPGPCESSLACDGNGGCVPIYAARGTPCDDADACSMADMCDGDGACTGTPYICDAPAECEESLACDGTGDCAVTPTAAGTPCTADALSCTGDACDGLGTCGHPLDPDFCLIADTCVAADEAEPGNPCGACLPAVSQTDYSLVAAGTSCDDGDGNTIEDICDALGVCAGTIPEQDGGPAQGDGDAVLVDAGPVGGDAAGSGSPGTPPSGCGCNSGARGGSGLTFLVGLFALLRRRTARGYRYPRDE